MSPKREREREHIFPEPVPKTTIREFTDHPSRIQGNYH